MSGLTYKKNLRDFRIFNAISSNSMLEKVISIELIFEIQTCFVNNLKQKE